MPYSTVWYKPFKTKRRSQNPTIDGNGVIQELGFIERQVYRFFWVTTAELQNEIERLEAMAVDGWIIEGQPGRAAIHEALDLFNVEVQMSRLVST